MTDYYRLKVLLGEVFDLWMGEACEDDDEKEQAKADRDYLLDLLDRQPSEEEIRSIKVALDQIYGAFSYDAPGFDLIRKALNIEEKEGEE